MKIYGAGSLEDIRLSAAMGACGILTNPQGFDQYYDGKMTLTEIARAICDTTDLPVFMQIHGENAQALIDRAVALNAIQPKQIGFKIISDEKGFLAIAALERMGIRCIATTLFTLSQAAVAASAGAFGICPFVSRASAIGMDPFRILSAIKAGYQALENPPEIIAVSLKTVEDVDRALAAGVDAVGMRYPLIREMMSHPLSHRAELLFARNWARVKAENVDYLAEAMRLEGIAE